MYIFGQGGECFKTLPYKTVLKQVKKHVLKHFTPITSIGASNMLSCKHANKILFQKMYPI